ncbi:MAG: hypothetical protein QM500_12305 [Methylococcales bacterium]
MKYSTAKRYVEGYKQSYMNRTGNQPDHRLIKAGLVRLQNNLQTNGLLGKY